MRPNSSKLDDMMAELEATPHSGQAEARSARLSRRNSYELVKRGLDVVGALAFGLLLSPVWLAAAAALKLTRFPTVLFKQQRVGQDGVIFTMLKFRTIRSAVQSDPAAQAAARLQFIAELEGRATPDANTGLFKTSAGPTSAVGRFLRRYSIDEIPQLLNVLLGDMSLVGPRPALPWEVELLSAEQRQRHLVRPGMTGLWQVSGRSTLTAREMLDLDLAYVRDVSLVQDLRILLKTPAAVLVWKSS